MNVKPREKSCRAIREVAEDTEVLNSPGEGVAIFQCWWMLAKRVVGGLARYGKNTT